MARRTAVRQLLARSRCASLSNVLSTIRVEDTYNFQAPVVQRETVRRVIFQQGRDKLDGSTSNKEWVAELRMEFTRWNYHAMNVRECYPGSDEEESRGSASISEMAVYPGNRNLENSLAGQMSVSWGCLGRFLGHGIRHLTSTTIAGAATSVSPLEVWNGSLYSNRAFSSVPAGTAESTQIAVVNRDPLDFSPSGAASDASKSVAGFPAPDSGSFSEVATAAADCSYPTAFVQYAIDSVHASTGLPWWASIAVTTLAIRVIVLPLMVYQIKATARLTLLRPELENLTNRIKESGYDPKVVEDNQLRMKALFAKHKTTPFSPLVGAFIQAPIFMCFFFAIRNMAEKMESFKEGGALWFTDLSTPDSLFIMPVLSGAFFLLTVELGATDGMQGQPMLGKMKMFMRGLAILLVPLTASFPKALFCYWLTANVCSIIQAAAFKQPGVKASLGIPDVSHLAKPLDIPVSPVVTFSQHPRSKDETRVATPKRQRR